MADTKVPNEEFCLVAKDITKIYPGTKALDAVNFNVRRGKVNVLIGENGAGKSTLMKIISGVEQPDSGEILISGQTVHLQNARDAARHGIGIIHQELNLFPNLTIAQNIFMAKEHTKYRFAIDHSEHVKKTAEILADLKHPMDPGTYVSELRVGMQQIVEIAKTMSQQHLEILIMDEPTSALGVSEVEVLFDLIRDLKQSGISIVYISHRMDEILEIGDYVTILRDGKLITEAEVKNVDIPWIVRQMIGEDRKQAIANSTSKKSSHEVLKVNSLTVPRRGSGYLLDHVSLSVREGEILGIYGLLGAGRTELLECLMGERSFTSGEVYLRGRLIKIKSIVGQIGRGFAYIPEDRQREGLVKILSIERNLTMSSLRKYVTGFHITKKRMDKYVNEIIKKLSIKVSDSTLPVESLSGGNQQKVVIGKGALTNPQILLLDDPTRGIDVNAKTEVFQLVRGFAEQGLAVIVVDSELKEIVDIADRVMVLSKGRVTGVFQGEEITEEALMSAATVGHEI